MQFWDFKLSTLILYVPQCQKKKGLCFRFATFWDKALNSQGWGTEVFELTDKDQENLEY